MKTYYTNYSHAWRIIEAGNLHATRKEANEEARFLNSNDAYYLPYIVARLVSPDRYTGEDVFRGYYVTYAGDTHLTDRRITK